MSERKWGFYIDNTLFFAERGLLDTRPGFFANLQRTGHLRQSVLSRAFSGTIAVNKGAPS